MLISCPNCSTNFAVPAKAIGENGKKVKCSKCSHVWLQKPIAVDKEKLNKVLKVPEDTKVPTKDSTNEGINLPAKSYKKANFKLAASLAIIFVLVVFSSILTFTGQYKSFANIMGLKSYYGLRFEKFKVESEVIDKKYDFYIKGMLVNSSDKQIALPKFNLKVLSQGGRVMAEAEIDPPAEFIEANSEIPFNPDITGISGNAEKVTLEFGNWLELMFR